MTNEDIDKKLEDIESRYYKGHKATSTEIADWWSKEDQKEYKRLLKLLDNTFYDVEFDVYQDIEGILRVNFVIDEEDE